MFILDLVRGMLDLLSSLWGNLFWRPHYEDPVSEAVGSQQMLEYTMGCNDGTEAGDQYVEYERSRTEERYEEAYESLED